MELLVSDIILKLGDITLKFLVISLCLFKRYHLLAPSNLIHVKRSKYEEHSNLVWGHTVVKHSFFAKRVFNLLYNHFPMEWILCCQTVVSGIIGIIWFFFEVITFITKCFIWTIHCVLEITCPNFVVCKCSFYETPYVIALPIQLSNHKF